MPTLSTTRPRCNEHWWGIACNTIVACRVPLRPLNTVARCRTTPRLSTPEWATTNLDPHSWKYAAQKGNTVDGCVDKKKTMVSAKPTKAKAKETQTERTTWARSTVCVGTLFGTPSSMPGRSSKDRCFKSARNDQANAVFSSGKPTSVVYSTW